MFRSVSRALIRRVLTAYSYVRTVDWWRGRPETNWDGCQWISFTSWKIRTCSQIPTCIKFGHLSNNVFKRPISPKMLASVELRYDKSKCIDIYYAPDCHLFFYSMISPPLFSAASGVHMSSKLTSFSCFWWVFKAGACRHGQVAIFCEHIGPYDLMILSRSHYFTSCVLYYAKGTVIVS